MPRYPAHFEVISSRRELMGLTGGILKEAHARMAIDGNLPRWCVAEAEVDRIAESVLAAFRPQLDAEIRRAEGLTGQFIACS